MVAAARPARGDAALPCSAVGLLCQNLSRDFTMRLAAKRCHCRSRDHGDAATGNARAGESSLLEYVYCPNLSRRRSAALSVGGGLPRSDTRPLAPDLRSAQEASPCRVTSSA